MTSLRTPSRASTLGIASAFLFFTFLLGVKNVSAATITVDALTNTGGAGCELREAILSANTDTAVGGCISGTSGTDSIVFSGSGTIDISNQNLPNITSLINMDGGSDIVVDAFNTSTRRIFTLSGTTSTTFGLSNITLQNGSSTNGGCISMEDAPGRGMTLFNVDFIWCTAIGNGGAVYMPTGADGSVEMLDVTFTSSSAQGEGGALWAGSGVEVEVEQIVAYRNRAGLSGGAIYATSSSITAAPGGLTIRSSTFTSNTSTAGLGGGGVYTGKLLNTIATSTFVNNFTTVGGGGGPAISIRQSLAASTTVTYSVFRGNHNQTTGISGGAIFAWNNPELNRGSLDIRDSLFEQNRATYAAAVSATKLQFFSITRSTFSQNLAQNPAGDYGESTVESYYTDGIITNSTFSGNTAFTLVAAVSVYGKAVQIYNNTFYGNIAGSTGGVLVSVFGATTTYANNIFEGNTANGLPSVCYPGSTGLTSQGTNLFDDSNNCDTDPTDFTTSTAQLGALQDNGGYTFTRLPADNSIVVNAANATYAPAVDQRNFARPQGAGYDIGAVDIDDDTAPVLAIVTPVSTPQSDLTPDFSFSTTEAGTLSYPGTCSSVTVQATSGTNAITFNTLTSGTRYDNCQVRLTDGSGNATTLTLTTFETTGTPSSGGSSGGGGGLGSAGTVAIPPVTTQFQTNLQNLQNQGVSVHGLIKIPSNSAVYYIGSDGKRHAFPNDKVYFTWYESFNGVQLVNEAQLASIPLGKNVTYKPGKKMVKFTTDNKVYVVAKGGILRWVTTEAAATELYGSSWNMQIDDISDAFYTNYTFGQNVTGLMDFNPTTVQASVQFPSDSLEM